MGKIFQLGGPCFLCPLLAIWLITRQYFSSEDCSISLVNKCFKFIFDGIMYLLATKFPIIKRKIIVNLRKIATTTFLVTGCMMLIF